LRTACAAVSLVCIYPAIPARAQNAVPASEATIPGATVSAGAATVSTHCQIIYLGFVGALELPANKHSGVVQIRRTLQGKDYSDVCANSFSPYVWTEGRDWLMKYFPAHAGPLTPQELQQAPKIILVGHSMGGWAVMSVARELRGRDIPVELTVQVDSVGITDYTIPRNVKSAAIFHANDILMFMTTKHMHLEDPNYTKILADVKVDGVTHQSITRDPRIRDIVMEEVESLRTEALAAKSVPAVVHSTGKPATGLDQK